MIDAKSAPLAPSPSDCAPGPWDDFEHVGEWDDIECDSGTWKPSGEWDELIEGIDSWENPATKI